MNHEDFRTIDVEKGAENEFARLFGLFGYEIKAIQEVRLDPFVTPKDLQDLYGKTTLNEAFCGFHLPKHSLPNKLLSYVKMTFTRPHDTLLYPYYLREEQNFLRLSYDAAYLGDRESRQRHKRFLPGYLLALYILMAIIGAALFGYGLARGASEGGALFADFPHAAFYFGIILLVAGLGLLFFHGLARFLVHGAKAKSLRKDKAKIDEVIAKLLKDLSASDEYPHVDFDSALEIETRRKIFDKK